MRTTKKQFIGFLFLIFFTFSCNTNNNEVAPTNTTSNLTFSASPFDLQGINARFAKDIAYDYLWTCVDADPS